MTKSICGCLRCVQSYRHQYEQKNEECNLPSSGSVLCDPDQDAKGYLQDVPPVDQYLNENLHLVWYGHFQNNFENITKLSGQKWILEPETNDKNVYDQKLWQSKEMAKVRFICDCCGKTWTSMKGIASFFATKSRQYSNIYVLKFKLFGQKCTDCKTDSFQSAIWYPEEVVKVINNVYDKIARQFYKIQTNIDTTRSGRFGLRVGRPRRSHISEFCQACQFGMCPMKKTKKEEPVPRQHNDSVSSQSTNFSDHTNDDSYEFESAEVVTPPSLMKQISVQSNVSERVTLSLASPSHQRSQY